MELGTIVSGVLIVLAMLTVVSALGAKLSEGE